MKDKNIEKIVEALKNKLGFWDKKDEKRMVNIATTILNSIEPGETQVQNCFCCKFFDRGENTYCQYKRGFCVNS